MAPPPKTMRETLRGLANLVKLVRIKSSLSHNNNFWCRGEFHFKSDKRGRKLILDNTGLRGFSAGMLDFWEKLTDFDRAFVGWKGLEERSAFVGTVKQYADLECSSIKSRKGGRRSENSKERACCENGGDLHIENKEAVWLRRVVSFAEGAWSFWKVCWAGGRVWDWFFFLSNMGERTS